MTVDRPPPAPAAPGRRSEDGVAGPSDPVLRFLLITGAVALAYGAGSIVAFWGSTPSGSDHRSIRPPASRSRHWCSCRSATGRRSSSAPRWPRDRSTCGRASGSRRRAVPRDRHRRSRLHSQADLRQPRPSERRSRSPGERPHSVRYRASSLRCWVPWLTMCTGSPTAGPTVWRLLTPIRQVQPACRHRSS